MRYPSPLRYPGGKTSLADFLGNVIARNELEKCIYYEPYAGGAGAALSLLQRRLVSELYINDADPRVSAFWRSVLKDTDQFVDRIRTVPLTIQEWHRQHEICLRPKGHSRFEVGFAAFFMNRCNRSGVLSGSGPIGGYEQNGKWKMDVRFNRDGLTERILLIGKNKDCIHVSGEDAIVFLKRKLPGGKGRKRVFVYLDPPYVNNGQRLYLNAYGPDDHVLLAEYLNGQNILAWLMSYDDNELVRKLYARYRMSLLPIRYSLQQKRVDRELIIAPRDVSMPNACTVHGHESKLQTAD